MKTTKQDVDSVYNKPIDPNKPFERLSTLMDWAISELKETNENKISQEAANIHYALCGFYRTLLHEDRLQNDKRLYDALDIVLDDLFQKSIPEAKDDPLYIPKITL
jgi:hypothetical protein